MAARVPASSCCPGEDKAFCRSEVANPEQQSVLCEEERSECSFRWHSAHASSEACRLQEHFACRKFLRKDVIAGVLAGVVFECVCRRAFMSYASASTRYSYEQRRSLSILNPMPWQIMPRKTRLNTTGQNH